jgi:hypothetical protein
MASDVAEVFTLSVKPDQNVDSIFALAKTLTARGLANGTGRLPDGRIQVLLFPRSAAKYKSWGERDTRVSNYDTDRKAILSSLAAGGVVPDECAPAEPELKPSEPDAGQEERENEVNQE